MTQDSPAARSTDHLIAEIARTREVLAGHRAALQRTAHVGDRLQRTYRDHAGLFLGAAAVSGMLLSLLPSSKRSRRDEHARLIAAASAPAQRKTSRSLGAVVLGLLGKLALDMGKPILLKKVRDHYAAAMHAASSAPPAQADFPRPTGGSVSDR